MQENRSFDHYYGTYRGVRGFDDHPPGSLGAFAQAWPGGRGRHAAPVPPRLGVGHRRVHQRPRPQLGGRAPVPGHGGNGAFVRTHTRAEFEGPEQGVLTMGYYRRQRPALLLRAGRRLHALRQLPLLGARADPPQPAHVAVGHDRPDGARRRAGARHQPTSPTPSTACAGTPCPRCSRTPASAGRCTAPRGRSTRRRSSRSTASAGHRRHPAVLRPVQGPRLGAVPEGVPPAVPGRLRRRRRRAARCRRSAGSSRRPATTSTRRHRRRWASGSPARCWRRWCPTPRCGPRRCCSSCTTRTTASSTTCRRPRRRRARRAST